jgi:hypothetical protein
LGVGLKEIITVNNKLDAKDHKKPRNWADSLEKRPKISGGLLWAQMTASQEGLSSVSEYNNISGLFCVPRWQIEHRKVNELIFSRALINYGLHVL